MSSSRHVMRERSHLGGSFQDQLFTLMGSYLVEGCSEQEIAHVLALALQQTLLDSKIIPEAYALERISVGMYGLITGSHLDLSIWGKDVDSSLTESDSDKDDYDLLIAELQREPAYESKTLYDGREIIKTLTQGIKILISSGIISLE